MAKSLLTAPPWYCGAGIYKEEAKMTDNPTPVAAGEADEPEALSTDQIMPTCMIYAMFIVLALLLGTMAFWMFGAIGALHIIH